MNMKWPSPFIRSSIKEKVDRIDEIPTEKRKHSVRKFMLFKKISSEISDKVIKTIRLIKMFINIKNKILEKHTIDKSHGAEISIKSPPKETSCLETLWFANSATIKEVKKNRAVGLSDPIKTKAIRESVGDRIKRYTKLSFSLVSTKISFFRIKINILKKFFKFYNPTDPVKFNIPDELSAIKKDFPFLEDCSMRLLSIFIDWLSR